MSKWKRWILAIVLIILFLGISISALGLYLFWGHSDPVIEEQTVLEIVLSGSLNEFPLASPLLQFLYPQKTPSLWELRKIFHKAAQDSRIKAILLEIHPLALSWGQIEEIRDQIKLFQISGKPIHAFLAVDLVREVEFYLAARADSITINPDAGFLINGLVIEQTFFKGTMDKIGVRSEFIQFKEYKSAEPYNREYLSPYLKEMLQTIVVDLEERFIATVAHDRNLNESDLTVFMKMGVASSDQGLKQGLVDQLGYRHQVETALANRREGIKYRSISSSDYLKDTKTYFTGPATQHHAAIVAGTGSILAGGSEPLVDVLGGTTLSQTLRDLREDNRIDGIILRVDSPGGSAVGSDMIWEEVRQLEIHGKPVIVSMSGVAGSGGYYISMGARHIVSQPSTITGSIGVIFGKFDLSGLYKWLGVTIDQLKTYPHADILSLNQPLNTDQRDRIEAWIGDLYRKFVQKAADSRRMDYQVMEGKARGRIYTGAQAQSIGLVDSLGGMEVAIRELKKALSLKEDVPLELHLYPKAQDWWEIVLNGDFTFILRSSIETFTLHHWAQKLLTQLDSPGPWLLAPELHIR